MNDRPSWQSWARLMPPRRATGDKRNKVRTRVANLISALSDDERHVVADAVEAIQGNQTIGFRGDLLDKAHAIVELKERYPDAWS